MGHHNLHFTDKQSAKNWAENYGGTFYDNMHSRGDDSGTSFTVREEFDEGHGKERECKLNWITKDFPNGAIVYHHKRGRGKVLYYYEIDLYNGRMNVSFESERNSISYWASEQPSIEEGLSLLSYTPYTLENGGFSRDKSLMEMSPNPYIPL